MSKPTNKPGWTATTNPSSEPTAKKLTGWSAGEKPSAEHMNWLFKTVSDWVNYIDVTPIGSGSLSAEDEARIAALEEKANVSASTVVNAGIPYGGQAASEVTSASSAIDWSLSPSQKLNLSGNASISFANGVSGKVYFLSVQQPSGGSATVTWPGSVSWSGGSAPVLSTAGNSKDIFGFYFDGSSYTGYAINQLKGFRVPQSGSETKNGYVAGGCSGGANGGVDLQNVEKIDFNSNGASSIVSVVFGSELTSTGAAASAYTTGASQFGAGTQSSTHGYRAFRLYVSLPTVNSNSDRTVSKFSFSNNTTTTLRPAYTTAWFGSTRIAVVQSELDAYVHRSTTQLAKLTFSTDLFSTVTGTYTIMGSSSSSGVGFSSSTAAWFAFVNSDYLKQMQAYKMQFSTETQVSLVSTWSFGTSVAYGGFGEGIDSNEAGYWQRAVSTTQSTGYKMNKTTDTWSALVSLNGVGAAAAGVQGNSSGYFCGGQVGAGNNLPGATNTAFSTIKRIDFSTDAYTINSESLKQARHFACGFEG